MLAKCLGLLRKRKPKKNEEEVKGGLPAGTEPMSELLLMFHFISSSITLAPYTTEGDVGASVEQLQDHPENHSTERPASTCSGADSLASIDTISDTDSNHGKSDVEQERNWRLRKMLKYSRWKNAVDHSTSRGAKRAEDIERRMAKQEQKLRDLDSRPRLEQVCVCV